MKKTLDNWLDVIILIVLVTVSTAITAFALTRVNGMLAHIGDDKVNMAADHLVYDDVVYTVGDLLLTTARLEPTSPCDSITVSYGGSTVNIPTRTIEDLADTYAGARKIMSLKPPTMANNDWYKLPVKETLLYNSSSKTYTYTVQIGG